MTSDKQRERLVELLEKSEATLKNTKKEHHNGYRANYLIANNVIVLPHALGSKVWCLGQPCGGCECYNEPLTEEFIERCRKCDKWEIVEYEFDYELIPEWGKLVFPTREQAEEALKGGAQG